MTGGYLLQYKSSGPVLVVYSRVMNSEGQISHCLKGGLLVPFCPHTLTAYHHCQVETFHLHNANARFFGTNIFLLLERGKDLGDFSTQHRDI